CWLQWLVGREEGARGSPGVEQVVGGAAAPCHETVVERLCHRRGGAEGADAGEGLDRGGEALLGGGGQRGVGQAVAGRLHPPVGGGGAGPSGPVGGLGIVDQGRGDQ